MSTVERIDGLINSTYCLVDPEQFNRTVIGGGVLLFSEVENDLYFLLAQEQYVPNWNGSLKWSAFEGGRKPQDACFLETVAREFFEESMGLLDPWADKLEMTRDASSVVIKNIKKRLADSEFAMCIALRVKADASPNSRYREHITFLVETQFDQHIQSKFEQKRFELLQLKSMLDEYKSRQQKLSRFAPTEGERVDACHLARLVDRLDGDDCIHLIYSTYTGGRYVHTVRAPHIEYLKTAAADLIDQRHRVDAFLKTVDSEHPAILYRDEHDVPFGVNKDYLEKRSVKYWKTSELLQLFANPDKVHLFRPYFLVVLQTALCNLWRLSSKKNDEDTEKLLLRDEQSGLCSEA